VKVSFLETAPYTDRFTFDLASRAFVEFLIAHPEPGVLYRDEHVVVTRREDLRLEIEVGR